MVSPGPPWRSGGIERLIRELAKRLKKDFNIVIYCTDSKPGLYYWEGLPVYVFRGYTSAYRFSISMCNILREAEYDLIHAHGFTTFMPLAASLTKKRIIFNPHFHSIGSTLSYRILRKIYDPIAGYCLFQNASLIVCNSNAEKNLVSDRFKVPDDKIEVIFNGVDIHKIKNAKPYNLNGKLILYVGRLEKYKNVQVAIQAVKYLPREYYLYIIGQGSYELNLRKLTEKLDLGKRAKFLGYLTNEEVYRWLKTCSLFIHLSGIESFGMTCIEALAAGKPVIVNDDNFGLKETADLFKGNIFTVNIKRVSAQQLSKLIEDKSEVQVNASLNDFDWHIIARKFKDAYIKALENSRARGQHYEVS